ncbi:MAG: hypothetical protein HON32_02455 [Francisellaceae bacterium]|nr:hypothetical protein [Francisellaceae bacterium]
MQFIDVPEITKRHIFECFHPNSGTIILLHIDVRYCQVMILFNNDILVIRSIDLVLNAESENSDWEEVAMEIQRSMDYANNIFGRQTQPKLYVLPLKEDLSRGMNYLAADLGLNVKDINFSTKIDYFKEYSIVAQEPYVLGVGQFIKESIIVESANAVN